MRLALEDLEPEIADGIRARLAFLLARSPFRRPSTWPNAVVIITPERKAAVSRLQLSHELIEGDMADAAREVRVRRVGPGEVLAYLVEDNAETAGVAFVVVRLLPSTRRT